MPDSGVAPADLVPHNLEAEQALLGALLLRNDIYDRVSETLRQEHFADALHGRIYGAIARSIEAGRLANPVTLKAAFDQDAGLAEVGGAKYLVRLAAGVVTIAGAADFSSVIVDAYTRRQLMGIASDLLTDARSPGLDRPAVDVLRETEAKLYALGEARGEGRQAVDQRTATKVVLDRIERAYKSKGTLTGVPSGLVDLDRLTGGFQPGNLIVIAGRPSMGKSALAGTISKNAAKAGFPNGVFSLEMSDEQWTSRNLAALTGISTDRQFKGEIDQHEMNALVDAADHLNTLPIFIDSSSDLAIQALRQRARRLARQHKVRLIIVDYLQLLHAGSGRAGENRTQEISEITRGLKALAKELNLPVIALSQLSRAVELREDKRPQLSDLRESGSIEQDADVVMFVYRAEYYLERAEPQQGSSHYDDKMEAWRQALEAARGKADLIIGKNRMGQTRTVQAAFDGARSRFESLVREFN